MPFPTAPVDWADIERRWRAGEGSTPIAKSLPEMPNGRKLTRQAIDDRAERENWQRGVPVEAIAKVRGLASMQALERAANLRRKDPQASIPHDVAVQLGWGKKTPETIALIVHDIELGLSETTASKHAGIDETTLANWKRDDSELSALIEQAKATFRRKTFEQIGKAGERGDWKATAFLGERSVHTRDDLKAPEAVGKGGVNIQVVLNIPRAEFVEPITIEHTAVPEPIEDKSAP